jgi:plasmid maintenance system killer protein
MIWFRVWTLGPYVTGNWRVIFRFDGGDAIDVDYLDYHGK